jgi:hypothetical protein
MHINSFGKGEQILLYPDGTVMNAKIIIKNNNGHPKSCIEYFFSPGVITEKVLLDEGDTYVVNKFMGGNEFSENYTGGLLKRINYFEKNIMVAYELVKMEDYEIADWNGYLKNRIDNYPDNPTYSDIYDIFVEMKKTLQDDPTEGVWNTQYGFLLGDIRSKRQDPGTTIESKFIYVGDGEDVL